MPPPERPTKQIHLKWDNQSKTWDITVPGGNATPGSGPNNPDETLEVEIHWENPYWVKVGTQWYLIG